MIKISIKGSRKIILKKKEEFSRVQAVLIPISITHSFTKIS